MADLLNDRQFEKKSRSKRYFFEQGGERNDQEDGEDDSMVMRICIFSTVYANPLENT
jgi:hypothetical protein